MIRGIRDFLKKILHVQKCNVCVAKINIALGFVLRNIETGEYRHFYAHENNTLFE